MTRTNSRLAFLGGLLLLASCTRTVVSRPIVDIPPKPNLPICLEAKGRGAIVGQEVIFDLAEIEGFRLALSQERACYVEREALLEAWGEKTLNRLRAVQGLP